MRIREREPAILADHRPVLHLVTAEHHALDVLDVEDKQSLRGQEQVIDLSYNFV